MPRPNRPTSRPNPSQFGGGKPTGRADRPMPKPKPTTSPRLPGYVPRTQNPQPTRDDINAGNTDQSRRYASVSAEGTVLPIVYGEDYLGPIVSLVSVRNGNLYLRLLWCVGEIDSIQAFELLDGDMPPSVVATHYVGANSQGVDPTLAAAVPGYNDRCVVEVGGQQVGIAYSVVVVPANVLPNFPRFVARIRGLKVRDPRNAEARTWSANPSLILADFIESTLFGMAGSVDRASLTTAANHNDELVSGVKRHLVGVTLAQQRAPQSWVETLRAYARCFVVPRGDEYLLVPDKAGSSIGTLTKADYVAKSFKLSKRSLVNQPNVVKVYYTSKAQVPWTEDVVEAVSGPVQAGAEFRRESILRMPGISDRSQATRFAIERLNEALLVDLYGGFTTTDKGWKYEVGDILAISHPVGLTSKLVRVTGCDPVDRGLVGVTFTEYDANVYSDAVASEPPPPDTGGQSPFRPPAIETLLLTESFYTTGSITQSQLNISWGAVSYPYLEAYVVEIRENGMLISTIRTLDRTHVFRGLVMDAIYSVKVFALSVAFVAGTAIVGNHTALGQNLPPDFSGGQIVAFEAGDGITANVRIPAVDIDLWGYEWRYLDISSNNIFPYGGPDWESADWTPSGEGSYTYNFRSWKYSSSGTDFSTGNISRSDTFTVPDTNKDYDVFVKFKDLRATTTGTDQIFFSLLLWDIGVDSGVNILDLVAQPGSPAIPFPNLGLWKYPKFRFPTASYAVQVEMYASGSNTKTVDFEIEYICIRESAPEEGLWESATFAERSAANTVRIERVPTGDYEVFARALDSIRSAANPYGQYSADIKSDVVSVVSDAGAFWRHEFPLSWTDLDECTPIPAPTVFEHQFEDETGAVVLRSMMVPVTTSLTWNSAFSSNVNFYTQPVYRKATTGDSVKGFKTNIIDLEQRIAGTARILIQSTLPDVTVEPTYLLRYSDDAVAWTSVTVTSLANFTEFVGRYIQFEVTYPAGGVREFLFDSTGLIEVSRASRTESGEVTTLGPDGGGDPQPVTVQLQGLYTGVIRLVARTDTTESITVYTDNLSFGNFTSFTVVALNLRGEPVAVDVQWEFTGF